jgi:hypothetical protein
VRAGRARCLLSASNFAARIFRSEHDDAVIGIRIV